MGVIRFGETEIRQVPDTFLVALEALKDFSFNKYGKIVFRLKVGGLVEEFVALPGDELSVEFLLDSVAPDDRWINETIGELRLRGVVTLDRDRLSLP